MLSVEQTQIQTNPLQPADEMLIDNIETLRALSDPLRLRILELLAEPTTVKAIAPKLDIGKTKLYYHLNLLEKHGVIRVVSTRLVSGIVEKSYQVSALRFRPAQALLLAGDDGVNEGIAVVGSMFEAARNELARTLAAKRKLSASEAEAKRIFMARTSICLTPAQAAAFYERLDALLEEMQQFDTPNAENNAAEQQAYDLTIAFFPKAGE